MAPIPLQPSLAERLRRAAPLRARPHARRVLDPALLADALGAETIAPGVLCLERRVSSDRCPGRLRPERLVEALPELLDGLPASPDRPATGADGRPTEPALQVPTTTSLPSRGMRRGGLAAGEGAAEPASCGMSGVAMASGAPSPDPAGWTFIDTETSGLAGGTGTWVFVCGFARIDRAAESRHPRAGLRLRQYLLTRLDAEAAYMEAVGGELAAATLLVSYNGKAFDLPLLETRLRLAAPARLAAALPQGRAHLDLLHPVRRAFGARWPDCRLGTCEARLLGLVRDDDLPGAEAPAAWQDWLQAGDPERLGAVLRHNRLDLISLAALIPALARVQQDPVALGADARAVARHLHRRGRSQQALALLEGARGCLDAPALMMLAALHRRSGNGAAARGIWQDLAGRGDAGAIECLAKYHEHESGDLAAALALTEQLPAGAARERRERRLRKMAAGAGLEGRSMRPGS